MDTYQLLLNPTIEALIQDDPIFKKTEDELDYHKFRQITFERLGKIIQTGLINSFEIVNNPTNFLSVMNTLHAYDLSLAVKTGVNFGLFGAGLLRLGHYDQVKNYVNKLNIGQIFGSLAITEIGHGSNLKQLETTATWDSQICCFLLNTPTHTAKKCWIGNAACHATHAIVFAQLIFNKENKGLHPFIVQLRDQHKQLTYGIEIEDNGYKKGLNGVDNGMIAFRNVIISRESLLSNFGFVDIQGKYICSFTDPNKRFGEILSTLSGGRGVLASGANIVSLKALKIACQYALLRKQFSINNNIEQPIISYTSHQLKLIPLLIKSLALNEVLQYIRQEGITEFKREGKVTKKLHAFTSGIKVLCTEHAEKCCRISRLACGGHGYAWNNELSRMHNDIDIYQTFEGDNTLLRLEVFKYKLLRLQEYVNQNEYGQTLYALKMMTSQKIMMIRTFLFGIYRSNDIDHILALLKYKEKYMTLDLLTELKNYIDNGMTPLEAGNKCQDLVSKVADSYIQRKVYETLLNKCHEKYNFKLLFGLELLKKDSEWYLIKDILNKDQVKEIQVLRKKLCHEITDDLPTLLETIPFEKSFIDVPLTMFFFKN